MDHKYYTQVMDHLNLDATGVKVNEPGYIEVDDYLEINVPGIFALGDCNGKSETNGFMRINIDAESNKILGASILGAGGDVVVSSILNIMYADTSYEVLRDFSSTTPNSIRIDTDYAGWIKRHLVQIVQNLMPNPHT